MASMIADDLTGACDAGVLVALRGLATIVWLDPEPHEPCDLVVISTNSRNDPPEEAREKVCRACRALGGVVFKKIDSTLHGNIVAEIEAVLEECSFREAWLAPAFPAQGRTVRDGWLYVGSDRRLQLPSLLEAHPGIRWFDTVAQEDLARVAGLAFSTDPRPLLAGSAGLAREVAALVAAQRGQAALSTEGQCSLSPSSGDVLFVIGSTNPVTLAQVEYLKVRHPEARVTTIDGLTDRQAVRALVLSGGDTALAVCRARGVQGIRLLREILPGIPLGLLVGGSCNGLPVVTKAGGFGAVDALAAILEAV
jgi:uncharacterized protein YgbK (DUF1537 family)